MKCVVCEHSELMVCKARFRPFLIARMFAGKAQDTDVYVCKKCGFEYSSFRPNDAQMQRQYDGYMLEEYLHQRESFEKGFIEQTLRVVNDENLANRRANLAQFIAPFIMDTKPQTILDYGGGGGETIPLELHYAKCFVFDISNKEPVQNISKIQNEDELCTQRFDLIICSHMLEHVSYPMEFMQKFLTLMHKDSLLYIEVPYAEFGWREDSDGAKLIHEHINMFKKETFIEMSKVLGLKVLACEIQTQEFLLGSSSKVIRCVMKG